MILSDIFHSYTAVVAPDSGWTLKTDCEATADGIGLIHLHFVAEQPTIPPKTEIAWSFPQQDITNRWTPVDIYNKALPPDWYSAVDSNLADGAPVVVFFNTQGQNRIAVAVEEAMRPVRIEAGYNEEKNVVLFKVILFSSPEAPLTEYHATIRIDLRDLFYADVIRGMTEWFAAMEKYTPGTIPSCAFDAIYSTWYSYHQNLSAGQLEAEYALAAKADLRGVIVDDGWQTDDNNRGYAFCGDWEVAKRRFPDMRQHVAETHKLGLKYMLWYSVPFVGYKSKNHSRFAGKYLFDFDQLNASVLDPRFPEVREFLINTYETAVKEWDLDGFKLDFIDSFRFDNGVDPAVAENYAGRDIKSLPLAVDALLSEVVDRLRRLKPEILIEFRQRYIGPAIRKYGNMFRAGDCPADIVTNRFRTIDLRLLSGSTAVHSDMLEWNMDTPVESAALQILNILFSVPQISIRFAELPEDHRKMLQFWLDFAKDHKDVLLKGKLTPYHPELNYPLVCAENNAEQVVAVYCSGQVIKVGGVQKTCFVINATGEREMILDLAVAPSKTALFDVTGKQMADPVLQSGLNRIEIPCSGLLQIGF